MTRLPVLRRARAFPELKLAYSEGQIGWIPYILERADDVWREHRAWGGVKDIIPEPPSTYYYRQIFGCFFRDQHGLEVARRGGRRQHHLRDRLPPHRLDVAPHQGGRRGDNGGLPDDGSCYKIMRGNAIRMLPLDLEE